MTPAQTIPSWAEGSKNTFQLTLAGPNNPSSWRSGTSSGPRMSAVRCGCCITGTVPRASVTWSVARWRRRSSTQRSGLLERIELVTEQCHPHDANRRLVKHLVNDAAALFTTLDDAEIGKPEQRQGGCMRRRPTRLDVVRMVEARADHTKWSSGGPPSNAAAGRADGAIDRGWCNSRTRSVVSSSRWDRSPVHGRSEAARRCGCSVTVRASNMVTRSATSTTSSRKAS